jgi:hypothetical protein
MFDDRSTVNVKEDIVIGDGKVRRFGDQIKQNDLTRSENRYE